MLILLVSCIIVVWLIYWILCKKTIRNLSAALKSDLYYLPLVGHAYLFIGDNEQNMITLQRIGKQAIKYGGLTKLWLGNKLIVVVAEPNTLEVLSKKCLSKPVGLLQIIRELIGNGSIFAPVPIWRPRRKMLAPIFGTKTLHSFVAVFAEQSFDMMNRLTQVAGGESFSIWKYVTTYTMRGVCETTLGIKIDSSNQEFLRAFDELTQYAAKVILQPWKNFKTLLKLLPGWTSAKNNRDIIIEFVVEVIRNKRKILLDKKFKPTQDLSVLEHLILSNNTLTETELLEEVLVMILAGTDTSAVVAAFISLMLSMHQDVQEKMYDELKTVFGDSNRSALPSDLHKMKYTEAVVKETLRLYPPVPVIVRETDESVELPSGLTIPSGCGLLFHIWALHRNPEVWGSDAEQFRPERFIGNTADLHPAAFAPFSYGPRGCLGYQYALMSLKTVLSTLVRQYRILPATDQGHNKPLRLEFDIMMRHVDNYMIRLQYRDK